MRILVVEDDPRIHQSLAEDLRRQHHAVDVVEDGLTGLDFARTDVHDVILLDILLPGCDGLEILETLRGEPETAEVPVLACTALGQRDSGPLLVQAGFDGLVAKPIDWQDLARLLSAVITPGETNS